MHDDEEALMAEIDAAFDVRLARADLARWRDVAIAHYQSGATLRATLHTRIPDVLRARIQRALDDCRSELEIRLVFSSVQDHQLKGR